MNFGKNITVLRKKLNLSQEQFADKIGVSRQMVSTWESNISTPGADKIKFIRETFGVSYDEIFDGKVSEKSAPKDSENKYFARLKSRKDDLIGTICGSIMIVATAYYLVAGFAFDAWDTQWIVFVIGGLLCALTGTVLGFLWHSEKYMGEYRNGKK